MAKTDYDVVVVGYGLAGQAATSLLAEGGHRVLALERWESLYGLPRTVSFDGEALRITQACGNLDDALRESSDMAHYHVMDEKHNILSAVRWEGEEICGFHSRISFYQPHVENSMHERALERGAEVEQGWELVSFEQDADRVTLLVRQHVAKDAAADFVPAERTITASYLIGADGARSTVREQLGIEREDFDFRFAYLSVDVRRKRPLPEIRDDVCITVNDPELAVTLMPIGKNRIRFEFSVDPDGDHSEQLTTAVGYELLDRAWGLSPDDVEIYRQVVYPFAGLNAETWRVGRAFIAGDAAHSMPPFMGQGACTAFRDAVALAWELDLVLRGVSDAALLDAYERERKPHARFYVYNSCEIGRLALDHEHVDKVVAELEPSAEETPPPPPEVDYEHGVLHRVEGDLGLLAGTLATQGSVRHEGEEGLFDDVVGHGFALVGWERDPTASLGEDQLAILRRLGAHFVTLSAAPAAGQTEALDHRYAEYFAEHGIEAFLQRPDFRIFAAVRSLDELPAVIDDLGDQLELVGRPSREELV